MPRLIGKFLVDSELKLHGVSREMALHPETHATRSDESKLRLLLSASHADSPHTFERATRALISMRGLTMVKVHIGRVGNEVGAPLEMELTGPTKTIMEIAAAYMKAKGVSTQALTHR